MTKITYLLGAGASYNACPILEKQAEMMIEVAKREINRLKIMMEREGVWKSYDFIDKKHFRISEVNEYKILWYIGHFGEKAKEFGTIDTYARKLYLNKEREEYRLLKMSVSVFFDLWENFYYNQFWKDDEIYFNKVENRYKSLFSVLLNNIQDKIKLNDEFKFITWNYDLQLEQTFQMFIGDDNFYNLNSLDEQFVFKEVQDEEIINNVFHLNGHRGFFRDNTIKNDDQEFILNTSIHLDKYWSKLDWLYDSTLRGNANFDGYIKYAWEHNLNDPFFTKIEKVIRETDVLIIIGYSFPAFNRKIDQFLFNILHPNKIKKIIYQDPNGNKDLILNLFKNPDNFNNKIEILNDEKSLKQFYLPNEYFISQEDNNGFYTF
jgi:hypothetical protein